MRTTRRGSLAPGGARGRPELPAPRRARARSASASCAGSSAFKRRRRAEIYARYSAGLADVDGLRLPRSAADVGPQRGTCTRCASSTAAAGRSSSSCARHGIGVQVNYMPVYWHPLYADLGYRRGMCPNAEAFYAEELSLPLFPDLTDARRRPGHRPRPRRSWVAEPRRPGRPGPPPGRRDGREQDRPRARACSTRSGTAAPVLANAVVTPFVTRLLGRTPTVSSPPRWSSSRSG